MYTNPPVNLHFADAKAIRFSMCEHSQMPNLAFHGQIWLFYAQKLISQKIWYFALFKYRFVATLYIDKYTEVFYLCTFLNHDVFFIIKIPTSVCLLSVT